MSAGLPPSELVDASVPEAPLTTAAVPALGQRARLAVIWNAGFNVFRDAVQFAVMLVLVRLLPPAAYGEFNLTNTIIGFITVLAFSSFMSHTLQIRRDEDVDYHLHFSAGAIIQGSLFILTNVVALGLRRSVTYAPVATLVHVMSITFLLEWPTQLRLKMLERDLDWRRKSILHGTGLIGNALLAVTMGLLGMGAYALLIPGMLVTLPFIIDLFLVQRWRPIWRLDWRDYAPAFHFGLKRIGGALLDKGRHLTESSMITAAMGYTVLGHYGRAVGLGQLICYKVATQLMYTLYPALTRMEPRTAGFQRVAGLVLRLVAWLALPTAVLFSLVATQVVHILYGPKWLPVVTLLPRALAVAAASSLYYVGYTLILAQLRAGWCLALDAFLNVSIVLMLFVALPLGLSSYLLGLVGVYSLLFAIALVLLLRDQGVDRRGIASALVPPSVSTLIAGAIAALLTPVLGGALAPLLVCVLVGLTFGILYVGALRLVWRNSLNELVGYLPKAAAIQRALLLS